MSSSQVAQFSEIATHLTAAKYYALAAFVMMAYDNLLTLPREVEKVWLRRFTGLSVLWFLNRWVFFLAVIPTIVSFHDLQWVGPVYVVIIPSFLSFLGALKSYRCDRYFRYPGYIAAFQRAVIGSVFILRIYCIYNRSIRVPAVIVVFLTTEIIVKLYCTIVWGEAVALPPGIAGCILAVAPENSKKFIWFYVCELWTDAVVLVLTVYRSYAAYKQSCVVNSTSRLWRVILKDGVVYFLVIFSANLLTVLMFLILPQDLKAINSDFGVMINSLMTARLILNLKAVAAFEPGGGAAVSRGPGVISSWEAAVLGDIGNDFEEGSAGTGSATSATSKGSAGAGQYGYELGYGYGYDVGYGGGYRGGDGDGGGVSPVEVGGGGSVEVEAYELLLREPQAGLGLGSRSRSELGSESGLGTRLGRGRGLQQEHGPRPELGRQYSSGLEPGSGSRSEAGRPARPPTWLIE